jgi:hypothetical protein
MVEFLTTAGGNEDLIPKNRKSSIHVACENQNFSMVKLLVTKLYFNLKINN